MLFHETVEKRFVRRAPHLLELDRLELTQPPLDRGSVHQHGQRRLAFHQWVRRSIAHRRQLDLARPMQH